MFWLLIIFLSAVGSAFAEDIRDIKPPVFFPRNYLLLIIVAALFILVGLIWFIRFLLKRIKKAKSESSQPSKTAEQLAYEALNALKAKNLPAAGKIKEYYSELSDIVRRYIENRFNIRAPEMTTEEFLSNLRGSLDLAGAHKNLLKEFLEQSDMVKFAKYGPDSEEINASFDAAWRFVDETKAVLAEPQKD